MMQIDPTKSAFGWDFVQSANRAEGGHAPCRTVLPGHSQLSVWNNKQTINERRSNIAHNYPNLDVDSPLNVNQVPRQTTIKEEGKRRKLARNLSLDRYLDLLHTLSRNSNSTSDYCQVRQLSELESSGIRLDDLKAVLSIAGYTVIARTKFDYLRQMCGMYLASPTCIATEIDLDLPDRTSASSPLLDGIKRGLDWLASGKLGNDIITVVAKNGYYSCCELDLKQNRYFQENPNEGSCSFSPEVPAADRSEFCQTKSETRLSQPVIPRIELIGNSNDFDCPVQRNVPSSKNRKWLEDEIRDVSQQYNINNKDTELEIIAGYKVLIVIMEDFQEKENYLIRQGLYIAEVVRPVTLQHDPDFCLEDCPKKHRFSVVRISVKQQSALPPSGSMEEIETSIYLQTDLASDCRIKAYDSFLDLQECKLEEAWALLEPK